MAGKREGFAIVVYREDDGWEAGMLPDRLMGDLDGLVAAVRQQPGTAIGFVDIEDEFLVALRVRADGEAQLLLSDASAAGDWDFAASVLGRIEPAAAPPEDVVPMGDLNLFGDLGLDASELGEILGDLDAYADEMLASIAGRLGFASALDRALDDAGAWEPGGRRGSD
jgi:putative tRNA adenosine deaminase-associated protein